MNELLKSIRNKEKDKGMIVPLDINTGRFIIFSDQHKGGGDLADDFVDAESNYIAALQYYYQKGFSFVNLGDCEELWECKPDIVMKRNSPSLDMEVKFLLDGRYYRVFGNHDLAWKFDQQQKLYLQPVFGDTLKVVEGILLLCDYKQTTFTIFLTHGHQGDKRSDGSWFSKWVVASIWTPVQRYLEININSVSDSFELVDKHNIIMHDWSATQPNLVFISGHTHKPVFASLDHIDRLNKQLARAKAADDTAMVASLEESLARRQGEYAGKSAARTKVHPSYFNSGCCCFNDGDISGLEIEDGFIRLIKWENKESTSVRRVLEEAPLFYIFDQM